MGMLAEATVPASHRWIPKAMTAAYLAKTKGKGWQDYKFTNPVSKKIEQKSAYIEKVDDLIVGCGVYKK